MIHSKLTLTESQITAAICIAISSFSSFFLNMYFISEYPWVLVRVHDRSSHADFTVPAGGTRPYQGKRLVAKRERLMVAREWLMLLG